MSAKYLIFTWQPARILLQSTAQFAGIDNAGSITREDKYFKYALTAGAKLTHDRQWELMSVKALTGGIITLFTKDPVGLDEQALATVAANTEADINKIFAANEEVIIKSASATPSVMVMVREHKVGTK